MSKSNSKRQKPSSKNALYIGHLNQEQLDEWAKSTQKDLSLYQACGGNLRVEVKAVDEPYFGGTFARLEVKIYCDRCKSDCQPGLFDEFTINEFLTKIVEEMSDAKK